MSSHHLAPFASIQQALAANASRRHRPAHELERRNAQAHAKAQHNVNAEFDLPRVLGDQPRPLIRSLQEGRPGAPRSEASADTASTLAETAAEPAAEPAAAPAAAPASMDVEDLVASVEDLVAVRTVALSLCQDWFAEVDQTLQGIDKADRDRYKRDHADDIMKKLSEAISTVSLVRLTASKRSAHLHLAAIKEEAEADDKRQKADAEQLAEQRQKADAEQLEV